MFGKVGRKFIWYLLRSTAFTALIGYALYKAGLISFPGYPIKPQRELNSRERNRSRRIGKIRVS
ncbi:hypothetical protein [Neobacillus niacini]|uniref:hypothetical protein n=1 Tax=Neobacillus niacini TaxID=86668 RepID=UPI0039837392